MKQKEDDETGLKFKHVNGLTPFFTFALYVFRTCLCKLFYTGDYSLISGNLRGVIFIFLDILLTLLPLEHALRDRAISSTIYSSVPLFTSLLKVGARN